MLKKFYRMRGVHLKFVYVHVCSEHTQIVSVGLECDIKRKNFRKIFKLCLEYANKLLHNA